MAEKHVGRRGFLRMATLAGMGTALAACAPKTVEKIVKETVVVEKQSTVMVKETAVPAAKSLIPVTVIISGEALTEADSFAEAQLWTVHLMEYNLKQKDVVVRYDAWVSGEDYESKLRMLTNSGELGDTIVWGAWECPALKKAKDKVIMPIDELMNAKGVKLDEWVPGVAAQMKINTTTNTFGDGPVYTLPGMGNPGNNGLFFNVDALKAAGAAIPTAKSTWSDVIASAQKINKPGAFGLQVLGAHGLGNNDPCWLAPFGAAVMDNAGKRCTINSPEAVKAYKTFYDLLFTSKVHPTPADMQAMGDYKSGSAAGKLLMYRNGPWGGRWFLLRAKNEKPEFGMCLAPASFDGNKGTVGNTVSGDTFGISANAKHAKECFDVLYHFTNKEAGVFSIKAGNPLPWPRKDVLSDASLDKFPLTKLAADGILAGVPAVMAANGRTGDIGKLLQQRLVVIENEKKMPDQAFLDALAGEIQKILDQAPA